MLLLWEKTRQSMREEIITSKRMANIRFRVVDEALNTILYSHFIIHTHN